MLGVAFHAGGEREHPVGVTVDGGEVGHDVLAGGQRAGLVEQHGVDRAHLLEREAVLHENAVLCRFGRRQRDDERDRKAQRMRAGDDQNGDRADQGVVGPAEREPHHGGGDRSDDRDIEQHRCGAVGQRLCPRLGLLRVGDETLDAAQCGVVTDGGDLHTNRVVRCHGAGHDVVALGLGDRVRFTGQHGLVDLDGTLHDRAIGRNPAPGPDQQPVADDQVGDRDGLDVTGIGDPFGLVGKQLGERCQCTLAPGRSPSSPASARAA